MRFLKRLDEVLGRPQLLLHRRLMTALLAAFVMPYVWLGVLLSYIGFMTPVVMRFSVASWLIAVPAGLLGFLCIVRYLKWRDKRQQANTTSEDIVAKRSEFSR